ncbi:hypothetical protein [Constantimarinum furrinae]|nr:hypothetical protein [Constantimarinum furrinae]
MKTNSNASVHIEARQRPNTILGIYILCVTIFTITYSIITASHIL